MVDFSMVDVRSLKKGFAKVPAGTFYVDAAALKEARRNVPTGEFH